jgi:hypothetical protein
MTPMVSHWRRRARHRRIARGFARRAPWFTTFNIDGVTYGGATHFDDDPRVLDFARLFADARTVLELGSLEGGQSFELAHMAGRHIVAVEGRRENVERARFAQRCLGVDNVRFVCANLEITPLNSFGRFDAVLCSGLLYHLPRPATLIDSLISVAPRAYIWTHYALPERVEDELDGMPGRWYSELGRSDPLSGMSDRSFWPTLPALVDRLRHAGFDSVVVVMDDGKHPNGPCVALSVRASGG